MKIVTVIGARPQFIKATAISRAIECFNCSDMEIREVVVHTGQHYDDNMSQVFFSELEMQKPSHYLQIGSDSHARQTGRMLMAIETVLLREKPQWLLVYGDTNSTLAGALAAAKLHIPIAHVEAGLRSFNRKMPEEVNRVVTDHLSLLLFAPTPIAIENLQNEGLDVHSHLTGDVMYDAALFYAKKAKRCSEILQKYHLSTGKYALATVHRAENTDDEKILRGIFRELDELAKQLSVVLPLHPRTKKALEQCNLLDKVKTRLLCLEPVGYLDMIMLEKNARMIITDSGGVQKEAFFYQTPCITIRAESEWPELAAGGYNLLVNPGDPGLAKVALAASFPKRALEKIYGDGDAAEKIVKIIANLGVSECTAT